MKIYFTASIVGKKYYLKHYHKIVDCLHAKKNRVTADHIIKADEHKIKIETKEERVAFHNKLKRWIMSADCMVVEASFPSISVGYEISLALSLNKPVLLLYTVNGPPTLLPYHQEEKLICEKYDLENVDDIIDNFLCYVSGACDSRFTFFITPEINLFLDNISQKQKLPKSVYLRKLIEKEMKK